MEDVKLRRRLWSTRTSIAVVRSLHEHDDLEPAEDLQVAFEDPSAFDEFPRLLTDAAREAGSGSLAVARNTAGEVVAFQFVDEPSDLPEDEVVTSPVYGLPALRGRSIEARTLVATGRLLAARGKHRAWAYLDPTNTNDLRAFREAGFAASGDERLDRYRLGRLRSTFGRLSPATRALWDSVGV